LHTRRKPRAPLLSAGAHMSDDIAAKLASYKQQLAQVEAAIAQDPDNPEWRKLRDDLVEVIDLTSELAQVKAGAGSSADAELRTYAVAEKCQAIYEQDGQWYNAKIVALTEEGYFVTFLGYNNTAQVDFNEVRPYQRPDASSWTVGAEVNALHAGDGRWYDAIVVEVKQSTVTVTWKGESEREEVDIDFVRTKVRAVEKRKVEEVKPVETGDESIPKKLEIRPDDSEETIEKKKKKLKMFKRQEKRDKEQQQGEGRRSSWQSFSGKNKTIKKTKNFHDPNWDPTRDHGELQARQQMEKYSTYLVREGA